MTDHSSTNGTPTVVVTGAAGYIGSRVVHQLLETHPAWTVRAIDNFYLGDVRQIGDVKVEHVDIRNRSRLETVLNGADIVMHLAAVSGVDDCEDNPDLSYDVNVTGTENVAWHCRKTGTALIFPYSMAVLGDPDQFPITAGLPRDPLNWYGRTKLLGERSIETLAEGAFPAHLFLKSNLYGEHYIDDTCVSKGTVINFFVNRAMGGEPLTVYEPGTQARNYIHVKDVANVYVKSAERLLDDLREGETGVTRYEVASDEDPSVMNVAELVQNMATEEAGIEPEIQLLENPRGGETLVSEFTVDTSNTTEELGWEPHYSIADSVRELITQRAGDQRPGQRTTSV